MTVNYPGLTNVISGNTAGATALISSGTMTIAGGANITISQAGNAISIVGGAGGAGSLNVSAGTTSNNLTNLVFSNSNGISFGLNGSTVTAQHNALTSQSNQALSAANGSFTFQTANFADSNGVSFSTGTQGIFATVKTDYLTSQSNQAISGSNGSFAFQTATFGNLNGMSFYTSNGSMVGSYTVPTITNSSWTVSDAASSASVARLAFTNLNGVTLSLSTGAAGSHTIVGSHNALTSQSNQAFSAAGGSSAFQTLNFADTNSVSFTNTNGSVGIASVKLQMFAVSNTTQSSSGTANHTALSFGGAGIASVGVTGGSVIVSVPSGAPSPVNFSAGTTSNDLGSVVFSNSNGVSFGLNGSTITASVNAGGGGIANAAGTQTATSGTVVFSNSNGISFGMSNSSVITAQMPQVSYYEPYQWLTGQNMANGTLLLQPIVVPFGIQATRGDILGHISNSTNAGGSITVLFGLYTYSGSSANSVSTASYTFGYNSTAAASSYSNVSGTRFWSQTLATWNVTPGQYLQAVMVSSSSSGTSGTISIFGRTANGLNQPLFAAAGSTFTSWGLGYYNSTTNAFPASIHISRFIQTGSTSPRQPWIRMIGTQ